MRDFWEYYWYKVLIGVGSIAFIALMCFAGYETVETRRMVTEACIEQGGQMYENICVESPSNGLELP